MTIEENISIHFDFDEERHKRTIENLTFDVFLFTFVHNLRADSNIYIVKQCRSILFTIKLSVIAVISVCWYLLFRIAVQI